MPRIIIVGGKVVQVSQEKAEKLLAWKGDTRVEKDRFVDLGMKNFVALNQIKQILFDERDIDQTVFDERNEKYKVKVKEWEEYIKKCATEQPDTKAKRMVKSGAFLLWKARLNKPNEISGELKDNLIMRFIKFFETEPKKWWSGKENYQDLIPTQAPSVQSRATGWSSIGELISKQ